MKSYLIETITTYRLNGKTFETQIDALEYQESEIRGDLLNGVYDLVSHVDGRDLLIGSTLDGAKDRIENLSHLSKLLWSCRARLSALRQEEEQRRGE